jgi:inorganic triphosphatase YgiF
VTASRVEAELKYTARDERPLVELARVDALGPASLGPGRTVPELDRYLDTADLRLQAVHWACRLRSRGGTTILSLKGPAEHLPGEVLHRRAEVEGPAGPSLDPGGWTPSAARDQLTAMTGGSPLVERFVLEQDRTERSVQVDDERVGGLSLDRVRVQHRGTEVGRMFVVELELDPAAVGSGFDPAPLAAALSAVDGLLPDPASKLERALAMLPRS